MTRSNDKVVEAKAWLAVVLAANGGFVDAVGYLILFHTFVAHLSGDSVSMAIHGGQRDWSAAFHRGFPIPMFVAGALVGSLVLELLARRKVRAVFAGPLLLQIVLLGLFLVLGRPVMGRDGLEPGSSWAFYALTALPALAMGLQSALLWRVGGTRVRTTFITGVLVSFTEELVKYLFWLHDHARPRRLTFLFRVSPRQPSFRRVLLLLGLWTAYVAGALGGTLAELQWSVLSLAIPIGGLIVAVVIDLARPVMPPP